MKNSSVFSQPNVFSPLLRSEATHPHLRRRAWRFVRHGEGSLLSASVSQLSQDRLATAKIAGERDANREASALQPGEGTDRLLRRTKSRDNTYPPM